MDFPAAGQALWDIYDATGIRPEWLIPGLAIETGLNPALPNSQGYPYYGINQISGSFLQARGIDPQNYLTWSASQQLSQVVKPYMQGQVNSFGPLTSGIRVYQANFYPASLSYAPGLDDTIVSAGSSAYNANRILDANGDGVITPRDLGAKLSEQVAKGYVQSAISQTYALRPGETSTDPVFGSSFSGLATLVRPVLIAGSLLFLASLAANYFQPGTVTLPKIQRALRI